MTRFGLIMFSNIPNQIQKEETDSYAGSKVITIYYKR